MRKEEENLKIAVTLTILILTLALSASLISAVGVATSYWDENPLKLAPGESTTVSLRLQSDTGETTLRATLDSPIAELVDGPEYTVPAGVENVPVNIKVTIPENAEVGARYQIYVEFQEISSGEGGMLHVAQGITSKVPLEVVGERESALYSPTQKTGTNNIVWITLGLIVLIVVFFAVKKSKEKE